MYSNCFFEVMARCIATAIKDSPMQESLPRIFEPAQDAGNNGRQDGLKL